MKWNPPSDHPRSTKTEWEDYSPRSFHILFSQKMSSNLQNAKIPQKLQVDRGMPKCVWGFKNLPGIATSPQHTQARRVTVLIFGHFKRNNGISISKGGKKRIILNLLRQQGLERSIGEIFEDREACVHSSNLCQAPLAILWGTSSYYLDRSTFV